MKIAWWVIGAGILIAIGSSAVSKYSTNLKSKPGGVGVNKTAGAGGEATPINLSLPFEIADLNNDRSGVNPLGVIRTSKDVPPGGVGGDTAGHGGIDMRLFQDSNIYAVADGEIVGIVSSSDPWGGLGIIELLVKTSEGEGWAFLYEHVTPARGVTVGKTVKQGQLIATKTAPNAFTAHFQLSKVFNNYQYNSSYMCWPDQLAAGEKTKLDDWFYLPEYRDQLIEGWRTISEEGNYTFRGLLDEVKFSGSPQLCYPVGTDVRIPVK